MDFLRTLARARARSAAGRWAEAAALWEQVVAANPVHGNHWDSLAEARSALGDHAGALTAYEKAAGLGVWDRRDTVFPSELSYRIACCRAALGDLDGAFAALERAVESGYRDLDRIAADERLTPLRSHPRFAVLLRQSDVDGLTRVDGFRADVGYFAREVKRRAPRPPQRDFDAAVDRLDRAVPDLSDAQLLVGLARLLRLLGDGHAYVDAPDDRADLHLTLPLQTFLFEDGVYVTATTPAHEALLGTRLLAVDGTPVDRVLSEVDGLIGRDNAQGPRGIVPRYLGRTALLHALGLTRSPGGATLTVRHTDGSTADVPLTAEPLPRDVVRAVPYPPGWRYLPEALDVPLPLYLRNPGATYWYTSPPGFTYVQFNSVADDPDEPLSAFVARLFDALAADGVRRLVLDVRWNGGGNTFLLRPLLHRLIGWRGELFVIIGRHTFSAAQNLCTMIADHTPARFVGEPTGSSPNFVGETVPFRLPYSGFTVNVSDLYWQTSWPMDHRTWIPPDLYAPPTFEAYAAGRDPALEAIIACGGEHLPGW